MDSLSAIPDFQWQIKEEHALTGQLLKRMGRVGSMLQVRSKARLWIELGGCAVVAI